MNSKRRPAPLKPARPYLTALGLTPRQRQAAVAARAFLTLWMPGMCSVTSVKKRPWTYMSNSLEAPTRRRFRA